MSQIHSDPSFNTTTIKLTAALLIGTLSTTLGLRSLLYPFRYADEFGLDAYSYIYAVPQQSVLAPRISSSTSHSQNSHPLEHGERDDGPSSPAVSHHPDPHPDPHPASLAGSPELKPSYTHPLASPKLNPFMLACGMRNISFGLTQFAFAYQRNWTALGVIWMCGVVVALADGMLVWKYGGGVESESAEDSVVETTLSKKKRGRSTRNGMSTGSRRGKWARVCGHWIPGIVVAVGGALLVAGY